MELSAWLAENGLSKLDPTMLTDEFGVEEAADLLHLEEPEIAQFTATLKPVQRSKFKKGLAQLASASEPELEPSATTEPVGPDATPHRSVATRSAPASPGRTVTVSFRGLSPPASPLASPERRRPPVIHLLPAATAAGAAWLLPKPRILRPDEYSRALLISHNRRDPAALNATYALVRALRHQLDPVTGLPFCPRCYVGPDGSARTDATYELWTDKEQLAESAGADWQEPIIRAMLAGVATIFFLGNAFRGSTPCQEELRFAVQQGLPLIPVFLEGAHRSEADFDGWLRSRTGVPGGVISSLKLQQFREWGIGAGMVQFWSGKMQVSCRFVCPFSRCRLLTALLCACRGSTSSSARSRWTGPSSATAAKPPATRPATAAPNGPG